jgi:hypothetical protein
LLRGRTASARLSDQPSTPFTSPGPLHLQAPSPGASHVERRRRARQRARQRASLSTAPGGSVSARANMRRHVAFETLRIRSGSSSHGASSSADGDFDVPSSKGRTSMRRSDSDSAAGGGAGEETQNSRLGCSVRPSDRSGLTAPDARAPPPVADVAHPIHFQARESRKRRKRTEIRNNHALLKRAKL